MLPALPGVRAPVVLLGRMCAGARRRVRDVRLTLISMLEISTSRASETASVHVVGELDGVEERLGFLLVLVEVRDEDVDASRLNVGKRQWLRRRCCPRTFRRATSCRYTRRTRHPSTGTYSPFFPAWSAWDSSAVSAFFQTGIKRSAEAFSSSGEGELDPVGILAGGVAYADALGHLDLEPRCRRSSSATRGLFLASRSSGCCRRRPMRSRRSRQGRARQRGRCKGKGSIGSFSSWWRPPCLPMTSRRRMLLGC